MTLLGNPPASGGFGSLASSSLPSLGGDPLARPSWKRSLQELAASNMAMTNTSAMASAAPPTVAAQMLLGSRTDFGSLLAAQHKKAKSQSMQTNSNDRFSYDALSAGGIEAVVRRHRDGMLERILKDEREQTQKLLDKAVERQVEDDWKEERKWWRNELVGDRVLVDATSTNGSLSSASAPYGGGSCNPPQGLLVADYSQTTSHPGSTVFATGCDPKSMQDHLAVVQQIQASADPPRIIDALEQVAGASGTTNPSSAGYKTTWNLLKCMLLPNLQTPIGRAQGAQSFYCKQYQTLINSYVKSASLSGQDISTPFRYGSSGSMAETIASYVKLVSGSRASVWEILYYCTCDVLFVVLCCLSFCVVRGRYLVRLLGSFLSNGLILIFVCSFCKPMPVLI